MNLNRFIIPLGIVTYSLLLATILSGLFRAKLKLKLKHHKSLALLTIVSASMHAGIILYLNDTRKIENENNRDKRKSQDRRKRGYPA